MFTERLLTYYKKTVDMCFQTLFPKPTLVDVFEKLSEKDFILLERKSFTKKNNITYLFSYKETIIQEAIKDMKYYKNDCIAERFGKRLAHHIKQAGLDRNNVVLFPIPASQERMKQYGFNQCILLIKHIQSNCDNLTSNTQALKRIDRHISQTKKSRRDRIQTKNTFTFDKTFYQPPHPHMYCVIIDDVYTTGATITNAVHVLKEVGFAGIYTYTIAH